MIDANIGGTFNTCNINNNTSILIKTETGIQKGLLSQLVVLTERTKETATEKKINRKRVRKIFRYRQRKKEPTYTGENWVFGKRK